MKYCKFILAFIAFFGLIRLVAAITPYIPEAYQSHMSGECWKAEFPLPDGGWEWREGCPEDMSGYNIRKVPTPLEQEEIKQGYVVQRSGDDVYHIPPKG